MPFNKPTLQELVTRIQADLESRLGIQASTVDGVYSSSLRRSTTGVLAHVQAGASHLLLGYLDFLAKQVMVDTAESDYLYRWAQVWGIQQKPATFARGKMVFKGEEQAMISTDARLKRQDGVEFMVDEPAKVKEGQAVVNVSAVLLGSQGNTVQGTILSLISPVMGVQFQAVVDEGGIAGGAEAEEDDSLRARVLARIQEPPHGGAMHDYKNWALEVPAVIQAFAYANYFGLGTVGVTFLVNNTPLKILTLEQVQQVQRYLDERRPVTADAMAFMPKGTPLDFTIEVTSPNIQIQQTIESELSAWLTKKAYPGMVVRISQLQDVISQATNGDGSCTLVSPIVNITYAPNTMPVFGTVSWPVAT